MAAGQDKKYQETLKLRVGKAESVVGMFLQYPRLAVMAQ